MKISKAMVVTSVIVYPQGRDKPFVQYTGLDDVIESIDCNVLILRQGATEMTFVRVPYEITRQVIS